MSFQNPEELLAKHKKEQEERMAEYNKENRYPETKLAEGKIIKIAETVSRPPKNNPMYEITIRTKNHRTHDKDGNPVKNKFIELKKMIVKTLSFHMAEFYEILKLAGFNLKAIQSQADLDDAVDAFTEQMPEITFSCKHQENNNYNNYTILSCENIAGGGVEEVSEKKDVKVPEITEADIREFDKADCLETAEEWGITLKGKTKGKMQTELIAHLNGAAQEPTAPAKEEKPKTSKKEEVEEEEPENEEVAEIDGDDGDNPFPDMD